MRISDWSSDVCSSDLYTHRQRADQREMPRAGDPQGALLAPVHQMPPGPGCMSAALVRLRRAGRDQRHLLQPGGEIGRASCRESVCPYVYISVVAVLLIKKYKYISAIQIC